MPVSSKHDSYSAMEETWDLMHDVCISERHMHSKGTTYLPRMDGMTDDQYTAYKKRASFPLFAKHTLESFVGMAMRKDLLIRGIDPTHPFCKNCDGKGTSLQAYAENLVRIYLKYGRCGTLIDFPSSAPGTSMAAAEKSNLNVRLAFYNHRSIINWKSRVVNNQTILSMVVLQEFEEDKQSVDEFVPRMKKRYRVLKLDEQGRYVQELYDEYDQFVDSVTPKMHGKPMNFIPFIIHGGVPVNPPILLPIAEQNVHWYMQDADYKHGLHWVAIPTPWVTGVDPQDPNRPQTIGPSQLWFLPDGAQAGMLEFSGAGLEQVAKSLDKIMGNIVVLSSQILIPSNTYDETATAASIRNATETASLSSLVGGLSDELTTIVDFAAKWGRFHTEGIEIFINTDFIPLTLSGADVSAYVSAFIKEGFSRRTLFELLKRGEIVEGERQFEDEIKDIETEAAKRRYNEVEQAKKISEATTKAQEESKTTQNPDSPERKTQKPADEPDGSN